MPSVIYILGDLHGFRSLTYTMEAQEIPNTQITITQLSKKIFKYNTQIAVRITGAEPGLKKKGDLSVIEVKREGSNYNSVHSSYHLLSTYGICRRFISKYYIYPFEVIIKER
jgi:hypothetical protein